MTKRVKLSKWAETAFQNDWELWRARTNEGMVVLGKMMYQHLKLNDGQVVFENEEE